MQSSLVLLFIYCIDRGSLSAIKDYRAGSAAAGRCSLYSLIMTPVGMKKGWKRFIGDLVIPSRFLYRDEFQQEFSMPDPQGPVICIQSGKTVHQLITAAEIDRLTSIDELADLVSKRLVSFFR